VTFGSQEPLATEPVELSETPFYPQTEFMCGPSALATALHRTGVDVSPEQLADQVYVPGRKGSLQLEMVAATRRHDRLAVRIEPNLQAIVGELAAGWPVLVLQNLGVSWLPVWHYAVVVGYDPAANSFMLRSGTTERLEMRRSRCAQSWARAGNWAIVVLEPGELPHGRDSAPYVSAVTGLESFGRFDSALRAYESGLTRWPANDLLLLGYANALYGAGEMKLATRAYRDLLAVAPGNVPALNNLAHTLGEIGCRSQALALIAAASGVGDSAFIAVLEETRREVEARPSGSCQLD